MITVTCETCGRPFDVRPYRAQEARYCSNQCKGAAYVGRKPANTGIYTARVEAACEHCGSAFTPIASRAKHGRGKYCSRACQYATIKARPSDAAEQRACFHCGQAFEVYRGRLAMGGGRGKYCSRACRDLHRHGLNHPQYLGGLPDNRGPNWQAQRRKALKRDDYTCQHCGGAGTDVHHIRPFRLYGLDGYRDANDLGNLITLCDPCHRRADAAIQRAERAG